MNPRRPFARPLATVLLLSALAGPAAARGGPARDPRLSTATGPLVEGSRLLPGGMLAVTAAARSTLEPERAPAAIEAALDSAAWLEPVFAAEGEGELARLNRLADAERFACSPDLYAALEAAVALAAETDGAYDPTAGPLARLWRQAGGEVGPDDLALADARQLVGWRLLLLEPGGRTARLRRPGTELTLDGLAPGLVMRRAAAALRGRGIARARLELGGETMTFTNHEAWSVAVPHPDTARGVAARLRVSNAAVATAGDGADDALFDPRTGRRPAGEGSVTVVTAPAPGALALARALRVLGREGAADYARRHPGVGVLWLERTTDGVRAWAWNLAAVAGEPGLRIEWQEAP